ncbi:MAG: AAA family ATPase [Deltaproteobacteria bacterium]|jgi:hypothetical protein|nr:AAA family ATPase [Deltaproteobacteria bacterium]
MKRFLFIIGISKFRELSIGLGMNNLIDITYLYCYSNVCGLTESDIIDKLQEYLDGVDKSMNMCDERSKKFTAEEIFNSIINMYDGYSWDGITKNYQPLLGTFIIKDK